MKWPFVSRRYHLEVIRDWQELADSADDEVLERFFSAIEEASALRADANTMLGWLVSIKADLAHHFGPYFVDGKATTRETRNELRSKLEPIIIAEPKPAFDPGTFYTSTVAVGLVPDRADRLISIHVGPCHTMISCEEAKELADQIRVCDRRGWGNADNGNRRRTRDPR